MVFFLLTSPNLAHLRFQLTAEKQTSRDRPSNPNSLPESLDGPADLIGGFVPVYDLFLESLVAVCEACDLGLDIFDDLLSGFGLLFGVREEGDGVLGGQGVDVGVYLLDIEEDS